VDLLSRGERVEAVQPLDRGQSVRDRAGVILREVADRDFVAPAHHAAIDLGRRRLDAWRIGQ